MPTTHVKELLWILENRALSPLFQPIIDIGKQRIYGYEALIRGPSDSPLHAPIKLFDAASRCGQLTNLEFLCHQVSALQFNRLSLPGKLFINTSPVSLLEADYPSKETLEILESFGIAPQRVVIELSEQYPLDDSNVIRDAILHYKSMGFEIAIDDLGAGYAGLRSWVELRPDYVKIDRHFIENIQNDEVKQEFVLSIQEIARGLGCHVIAEGIETLEEYNSICRMGIGFGQGYHLARPLSLPTQKLPESAMVCDEYPSGTRPIRLSETISSLALPLPTVTPATRVEHVADMFHTTSDLHCVPVVADKVPVGVVNRNDMLELFASRYGRELHGKKPIKLFMNHKPIIVEYSMPVEVVSRQITEDTHVDIGQNFIIVKNKAYLGIGRVRDLLRKITELQIRNARHSNPLTQLPGNVPIYELIDQLLAENRPFWVAYFDLNNFKPYNDVYGYTKGDLVLQKVASIISANVDPQVDFVGHIGGDDFIIVFRSEAWKKSCQAILNVFEREVISLYDAEHRNLGGIRTYDRQGTEAFFPFLSLAIGVAKPDPMQCNSHHEVASLATEAKHEAKRQGGNTLFISRRRGPAHVLPLDILHAVDGSS